MDGVTTRRSTIRSHVYLLSVCIIYAHRILLKKVHSCGHIRRVSRSLSRNGRGVLGGVRGVLYFVYLNKGKKKKLDCDDDI